MSQDPDTLVTLTESGTQFEAQTLVNDLRAEDIPAFVFSQSPPDLGYLSAHVFPYVVQVRRKDVELARRVLDLVIADSKDLDWAEVDVGQPVDPLVGRVPRLRASRWGPAAFRWLIAVPFLASMMIGIPAALQGSPVWAIGAVLGIVLALAAAAIVTTKRG